MPEGKKSAFAFKLYCMLQDAQLSHLMWWTADNGTFALKPDTEFAACLNRYFEHSNVASFVRQLHMYGFHKVNDGSGGSSGTNNGSSESETVWEFRHSQGKFRKDDPEALSQIRRRTSKTSHRSAPSSGTHSQGPNGGNAPHSQLHYTYQTHQPHNLGPIVHVSGPTQPHQPHQPHNLAPLHSMSHTMHTIRPEVYTAPPSPPVLAEPFEPKRESDPANKSADLARFAEEVARLASIIPGLRHMAQEAEKDGLLAERLTDLEQEAQRLAAEMRLAAGNHINENSRSAAPHTAPHSTTVSPVRQIVFQSSFRPKSRMPSVFYDPLAPAPAPAAPPPTNNGITVKPETESIGTVGTVAPVAPVGSVGPSEPAHRSMPLIGRPSELVGLDGPRASSYSTASASAAARSFSNVGITNGGNGTNGVSNQPLGTAYPRRNDSVTANNYGGLPKTSGMPAPGGPRMPHEFSSLRGSVTSVSSGYSLMSRESASSISSIEFAPPGAATMKRFLSSEGTNTNTNVAKIARVETPPPVAQPTASKAPVKKSSFLNLLNPQEEEEGKAQ